MGIDELYITPLHPFIIPEAWEFVALDRQDLKIAGTP
jgi:hypothetical protein